MNKHQELAIRALENAMGDDLERATRSFSGMSYQEMQQEHGYSGKTCAQILEGYREWDRKHREAIEWVRGARYE